MFMALQWSAFPKTDYCILEFSTEDNVLHCRVHFLRAASISGACSMLRAAPEPSDLRGVQRLKTSISVNASDLRLHWKFMKATQNQFSVRWTYDELHCTRAEHSVYTVDIHCRVTRSFVNVPLKMVLFFFSPAAPMSMLNILPF